MKSSVERVQNSKKHNNAQVTADQWEKVGNEKLYEYMVRWFGMVEKIVRDFSMEMLPHDISESSDAAPLLQKIDTRR